MGAFKAATLAFASLQPMIVEELDRNIALLASVCIGRLSAGGCIYFFGNGGSAADAQHFAAELTGRYLVERAPLAAQALTTDTSVLTAIGNDYGFDQIFARQVLARVTPRDVVIGITTSGKSKNVGEGLKVAGQIGAYTVAMTGYRGITCTTRDVDLLLAAPFSNTPRIQECHQMFGHALCEIIEKLHTQPETK